MEETLAGALASLFKESAPAFQLAPEHKRTSARRPRGRSSARGARSLRPRDGAAESRDLGRSSARSWLHRDRSLRSCDKTRPVVNPAGTQLANDSHDFVLAPMSTRANRPGTENSSKTGRGVGAATPIGDCWRAHAFDLPAHGLHKFVCPKVCRAFGQNALAVPKHGHSIRKFEHFGEPPQAASGIQRCHSAWDPDADRPRKLLSTIDGVTPSSRLTI